MSSENDWENLGAFTRTSAWRELVPFNKPSSANALALPTDTLTVGIDAQIGTFKQVAVLTPRLTGIVMGAVSDRIKSVIATRTPSEILQAIVRLVVIKVSSHQSLGTGTSKGFQHKMMDTAAAASREDNSQASTTAISRFDNAARRTDRAFSADFVAFNSRNRFPHMPILREH